MCDIIRMLVVVEMVICVNTVDQGELANQSAPVAFWLGYQTSTFKKGSGGLLIHLGGDDGKPPNAFTLPIRL